MFPVCGAVRPQKTVAPLCGAVLNDVRLLYSDSEEDMIPMNRPTVCCAQAS